MESGQTHVVQHPASGTSGGDGQHVAETSASRFFTVVHGSQMGRTLASTHTAGWMRELWWVSRGSSKSCPCRSIASLAEVSQAQRGHCEVSASSGRAEGGGKRRRWPEDRLPVRREQVPGSEEQTWMHREGGSHQFSRHRTTAAHSKATGRVQLDRGC